MWMYVPAPECQLLYYNAVLLKALYYKIKNISFYVFFYVHINCVKSIMNLLPYSIIWPIVLSRYLG